MSSKKDNFKSEFPRSCEHSILYCFDFDGTLVHGHLHNYLVKAKVKPGFATSVFVQEFYRTNEGIRCPAEWKELFQTLRDCGQSVAITTFSSYPEVVPIVLKDMGLDEEHIKSIHVVSGMPARHNRMCKNEHIAKARTHFNLAQDISCMLIDDDLNNILVAEAVGHLAVWADPDQYTFIDIIRTKSWWSHRLASMKTSTLNRHV